MKTTLPLKSKKTKKIVIDQLAAFLQQDIVKNLPITNKDNILIGKYKVEYNSNGYFVIDLKKNILIAETFTKSAALALIKALRKNDTFKHILDLDKIIEKNTIDSLFYKNTIKKTKNKNTRIATIYRLQLASMNLFYAKEELYSLVIDDK